MNSQSFKSRLLASSVVAGSVFSAFSLTAVTQEEDDDEARQEKVVVTGSRIVKRDYYSNSPIQTISNQTIEATGTINVEELINIMPQAVPGLTRHSNNPGNGTATVDLRGLGGSRTMVLVDGKRFTLSGETTVDVNSIPPSLLEKIEVITGGAAAVYGSDAMSGVVNFILRKDFEGVEYRTGYEATVSYGDAEYYDLGFTFGAKLDEGRGNILIDMGHTDRKGVLQGARDFSKVVYGWSPNGLAISGSANIPEGRASALGGLMFNWTTLNVVAVEGSGTDARCANTAGVTLVTPSRLDQAKFDETPSCRSTHGIFEGQNEQPNFRPWISGGSNPDRFNYAPFNYLQLPQERFHAFSIGEYNINDNVTAYGRMVATFNQVSQVLAPTPASQVVSTHVHNPLLPPRARAAFSLLDADEGYAEFKKDWNAVYNTALEAAKTADPSSNLNSTNETERLAAELAFISSFRANPPSNVPAITDAKYQGDNSITLRVSKRVLEVDSRYSFDDRWVFSFMGGIKGDVGDNLSYDAYFSVGRYQNNGDQEGNIDRARYIQGINAMPDPNDSTRAVCVDSSGGCVPVDVWGYRQISPEAVTYIRQANNVKEESNERILAINLNGDTDGLLNLQGGPIGWATGFEYRERNYSLRPDELVRRANIIGFNAQGYTSGGFDVYELYAELSVPIASGRPWAELVELELAFRYSDYSTVGGQDAFKVGGTWALSDEFRIRGLWNTAVRVPNNDDLYAPVTNSYPGATDPCNATARSGRTDNASIVELCTKHFSQAGAVFSNSYNQSNTQIEAFSGGNPDLDPETGETLTVGFVYQPNAVDGLSITLDGYDIQIEDIVSTISVGIIFSQCYYGNPNYDPNFPFCQLIVRDRTGEPQVYTTNFNLSTWGVKGVDLDVRYNFEVDALPGSFNVTYIANYLDAREFEAFKGNGKVDLVGSMDGPYPKYKHAITTSWVNRDFSLHLNWSLISKVTSNPFYVVDTIDAYSLFSLNAIWDTSETVRIRGGIRNLFDKSPPILGWNQEQANTIPGTYDPFGRAFYIGTRVVF